MDWKNQEGVTMGSLQFPGKDQGVAVLVNLDKCIACRACQVACKDWNGKRSIKIEPLGVNLTSPRDLTAHDWKVVFFYESEVEKKVKGYTFRQVEIAALPFNCMHCVNAPCARACPSDAIQVSKSGAVVIVRDVCIGCGYCLNACPFDVPRRGDDGKFYKCTFCVDRVENGRAPACVEVCPTGVFEFGPAEEIYRKAKEEAKAGKKVYGIEGSDYIGGATRWVFVASDKKSFAIKEKMPDKQTVDEMALRETLANVATVALPVLAAGAAIVSFAAWRSSRKLYKGNQTKGSESTQ